MKKIFITGGHFAPAKAVIGKLSGWKIYYLGRKYAMEDDKALALEFLELSNLNDLSYLSITTGRLQRKFFVNIGQSIKSLLKIPVGFMQSFYWLIRFQPRVVLSFGGYVALPVVINAWLLGIPILTHEQTAVIGLANRIIKLFASKTLLAKDVGVPLREEILKVKRQETKTIYITGGNQGSHVINKAVGEIVEKLINQYKIIHQTGDSVYGDFEKLVVKQNRNYEVKKFLTGEESARALACAKLVISRAGANTATEIAFLEKPAILIPIPWSSGGEQEKNAQRLVNLGLAEILPQQELSGKSLLAKINTMMANIDKYKITGPKPIQPDAAATIVAEIEKLT